MLDAGKAPQRIGGTTVFEDHADPQVRYVLAEAPRVRADPDPAISLLLFRGDQEGALLQVETWLSPGEAELAAVSDDVLERTGRRPRLVRPDWRRGQVHLAGWLEKDTVLAPVSVAVGPPSLLGDPSSVISARLDRNAAALAEQALRGDGLPTVVIYELDMLGLAGPLGVEVEADLQAIHDRLTAEGALTLPFGRARIAKTWEDFVRDNLIRVTVLDESGDVHSQRAEAMRRVGTDLVARMFSPFPPPEAAAMMSNETVAAVELSFRLTIRREALETTSRWSFHERAAVPIRHHAAASLIGFLGDRSPAEHIFFADLAPPARELVVRAEPELGVLGIAALEVDLRLGDGDAAEALAVTLTPDAVEARLAVQRDPTTPLSYRVRARFDPELTRAEARESDWIEVLGSTVVVSARRTFPSRTLAVVAGRVELDWLDRVEVLAQAPGEPARTLRIARDERSAQATFAAAGDGPLAITLRYHGRAGEPSLTEERRELPPGEDLLIVDGPFAPSIHVLAVRLPVFGAMSTVVDLEVRGEDWVHMRTVAWDGDDRTPRDIALRRLAGMPATYRMRTTTVYDDGRVEDGEWIDTDAPTVIVGALLPSVVHRTEVVLLGGVAGRGAVAIELTLSAGDASARTLLEGTADRAELTLVAAQDAPPPELVVRELTAAGEAVEHRFPSPSPLTILPMPIAAPVPEPDR